MKIPTRPKVILRHCDIYDAEVIRRIVREGMEALDVRPRGRTLVKPNCVAAGDQFPHACTRPEFLEGVLRALQDRDIGTMTELAVGERCGITVPSRPQRADVSARGDHAATNRAADRRRRSRPRQVELVGSGYSLGIP